MKPNQNKIKLFLFSAIFLIILLVGISIFQIVCIKEKQQKIKEQQTAIAQLEQQLNYYTNNR